MAKRRRTKRRKRRAKKTAVDLTVWARGEKIESCVHFGDCLDVSWDRFGFSICPINPPSPIDPVPIDIYRFDPRRSVNGRPLKKQLIGSVEAVRKKVVRFSASDTLSLRVDALSNCGGGLGQVVTGTCCITCNGVKACGCAVEMECGSCCSGECCN